MAMHPGRSGTYAARLVPACSTTTAYRFMVPSPAQAVQPACLKMLDNVPGGTVWLGWPATVTRPVFVGCLNWRCPPFAFTRTPPSGFSRRSTSRTVMSQR